jgi:hypothetical protein
MMNSYEKLFKMPFSNLYPNYILKAEKKGRTKAEVDLIICWLTGHDIKTLNDALNKKIDVKQFFSDIPKLNKDVVLIKGLICGIRVEDIDDPLIKTIRYLDKLVDELAKGKSMDKILRR